MSPHNNVSDSQQNTVGLETASYNGNIFKFEKDGYVVSTPPLSYHIFQYMDFGDNYLNSIDSLSESQKESYREYARILYEDRKEFRKLSLALLSLASHKVMRIGHSLLCWSTPEDKDHERLLLADFKPESNSLDGTSALVMLKTYKAADKKTHKMVEHYTEYPIMLVHKDFGEQVERLLQKLSRYKEDMRVGGVESYLDYNSYSCKSKTRKIILRKFDVKDDNRKTHRLYSVETLDLIKQEGKVFTKKQLVATVHEDNLKRRTNAFLIFAVFYSECARMLEEEELSNIRRSPQGALKVGFVDSTEEMCQISPIFNPTMAKVLINCLRVRKTARLKRADTIRYLPNAGYLRLHKNEMLVDGHVSLGPKSKYKFYIDTIEEDILFESDFPVVTLQAYHELSRMYSGCQEMFDRPDPSLNVHISKQKLDGKGNFIDEPEERDLVFSGKYGRSGRTKRSQYIHKKWKAEAHAAQPESKEDEQKEHSKKAKRSFKPFWRN